MPKCDHRDRFLLTVQEWAGKDYHGEGHLLPMMLQVAVPIWMNEYKNLTDEQREEHLRRIFEYDIECTTCDATGFSNLNKGVECKVCKGTGFVPNDFCLRLEYVLHKGPKEGDSAKAFNDLAAAIALLSFCPEGVTCFGTKYQWQDKRGRVM